MATRQERDLATALTGLCTFLVQPPGFEAGDEVEVIVAREQRDRFGEWLPLTARRSGQHGDELAPAERRLAPSVALVRASLARTGGIVRDSMNRPSEEYDPAALTLSDVRVLDHRSTDGTDPRPDTED